MSLLVLLLLLLHYTNHSLLACLYHSPSPVFIYTILVYIVFGVLKRIHIRAHVCMYNKRT